MCTSTNAACKARLEPFRKGILKDEERLEVNACFLRGNGLDVPHTPKWGYEAVCVCLDCVKKHHYFQDTPLGTVNLQIYVAACHSPSAALKKLCQHPNISLTVLADTPMVSDYRSSPMALDDNSGKPLPPQPASAVPPPPCVLLQPLPPQPPPAVHLSSLPLHHRVEVMFEDDDGKDAWFPGRVAEHTQDQSATLISFDDKTTNWISHDWDWRHERS